MNWAEAVVVIVIVVSLAKTLRARFYADAHMAQDRHGNPIPIPGRSDDLAIGENAELRRELAALQERIKVLERIATDERRPQALAAEIEALREPKGGA